MEQIKKISINETEYQIIDETALHEGDIPTNVSAFTNDAGYLTEHQSLDGLATEDYVQTQIATIPTPDVSGQIGEHNVSESAHNDIRLLIEGLTTRLNTLANSDDTTLDQMAELVEYIKDNRELIEGVTTNKVNVSDIIDNLTTNVTNKPLSAAQGVALKALIDAIDVPTKVSELTNDSGFITSYTETDPTVPSWAKASTKPSYTKGEVGLGNVDNVKQYSASNPPPYPVTKVNNKTGAVTLSASDVGADASGTASSAVSAHNASTTAHADIREQINQLSSEKVDKTGVSLGIAADGLIYIFVDGNPIGTGIPQGQSGDVFGYVDENNTIVLTGALPDGIYSIKYEMEDGSTVDIGGLTLGKTGPTNLADPTSSDWLTDNRLSTSSGGGSSCTGHILTNYIPAKMGDVVRVKGLDITAYVNDKCGQVACYKSDKTYQHYATTGIGGTASGDAAKNSVTVNGDILTYTIAVLDSGAQRASAETAFIRLDGALMDGYTKEDVIITINEEIVDTPVITPYTNLLPLAIDTDGTLYNGGLGYIEGYRLSGSSATGVAELTGCCASGYMPISSIEDTIRIKNVTPYTEASANRLTFYDSSKTKLYEVGSFHSNPYVTVSDGVYECEPKAWTDGAVAYFRFSAGVISENTIVTVNQEIV